MVKSLYAPLSLPSPPPLPPSPTLYYRDHAISKSTIAAGAVVVLEIGREEKKATLFCVVKANGGDGIHSDVMRLFLTFFLACCESRSM